MNGTVPDKYVYFTDKEAETQGHSQLAAVQCSFLYAPDCEFICTSASAKPINRKCRTYAKN